MSAHRFAAALLLAVALVATPAAAAPGPPVQDRIELPDGWQPEGVTTNGKMLWSGSLATGALLRANPRTGRTHVLPRSETGLPAVGIDYDARRGVIWVAGGDSGEIRAQSARSGRVLATYTLPSAPARFVNDLVVTPDAVYATDSLNPELAVVPLDGRRLPASGPADVVPLAGELVYTDGFNANGIVASGGWLVTVQSNTGNLYRVDPATGVTQQVDLGGITVVNGDGLELDGDRLYVVRNRDEIIVVVDLAEDLLSGEVAGELSMPEETDVPTTAVLLGDSLWVVNARFGNPEPETASYWMTRFDALP